MTKSPASNREELLDRLARIGAEARLKELLAEREAIFEAFPQLRKPPVSPTPAS